MEYTYIPIPEPVLLTYFIPNILTVYWNIKMISCYYTFKYFIFIFFLV